MDVVAAQSDLAEEAAHPLDLTQEGVGAVLVLDQLGREDQPHGRADPRVPGQPRRRRTPPQLCPPGHFEIFA